MKICPKCKNRFTDDTPMCEFCKIELDDAPLDHSRRTKKDRSSGALEAFLSKLPFKVSPKLFKICLAAVALVIVLIIVISIFFSGAEPNYMLYVQDDEVMFSTVSDAKGQAVNDKAGAIGDVKLSADGKRIFYLDANNYLYCKDIGKLAQEGKKLSSKVAVYYVNNDGSIVTYIENDNDLKQHNLKEESNTIAKDVSEIMVSENGKKILAKQITDDGTMDLLLSVDGKKAEKIVSNVGQLYNVSDDFKSFYFTKNGAIYSYKEGKEDNEKIVKEFSSIVHAYESGEIYYTKASLDADGNTKEALYYFDGKESTSVSKDFTSYNYFVAVKKPVLIYSSAGNTEKVQFYVATCESNKKIDYNISKIYLEPTGDELYFISDLNDASGEGDLYKAKIKDGELRDAEKIASDVYKGKYLADDTFVFISDTNKETRIGDLYLNSSDKEIAKDVSIDLVYYLPQKKQILFFGDVKDAAASLCSYSGGRVAEIDEDVYVGDFYATANGDIMYLKDYDPEDAEGDLYICSSTKGQFVGNEVSKIKNVMTKSIQKYVESGYNCYFASTTFSDIGYN